MSATAGPFRCEPDPAHPGWLTWDLADPSRFNAAIAPLLVRAEGERSAIVRLIPGQRHSNMHDMVHGGVILGLIDIALFAASWLVLGPAVRGSVTLDLANQFIGGGRLGEPLDAVTEVVQETGRLVFLRGIVRQEAHVVASFTGSLRKPSRR